MVVRIEICWTRICSQLEVTKELASAMTDEQKDLQHRTFSILRNKLEAAIQKLARFTKGGILSTAKKLKFMLLKDTLEETIKELESWQQRYQPSWFQLIKLAPPMVDGLLQHIIKNGPKVAVEPSSVARNLRRATRESSKTSERIFISEEALNDCTKEAIPFCTAMVVTRPRGSGQLIVDMATNVSVQSKDVKKFALRLQYSDPFVFGLFNCKGAVKHTKTSSMAFLFRVPEGYSTVRSVRQLLLSGQTHDSLSDRLEMAKQLANAVYYVHLYGFVHKNIHPETILGLSKTGEGRIPRTACLIGFQVIRNADGRTYPMTDKKWEANLYRHPQRQGTNAEYYVMQHDIYSLGVCLLEIGLWESFVAYDDNGTAQPSAALGLTEDRAELKSSFTLKGHLVALSRSSMLRVKMGNRYSEVVETCLTCLDEDNLGFGDEQQFQDEDGVLVGVRYIEKVLGILNDISI
jgi:hypothetical protein